MPSFEHVIDLTGPGVAGVESLTEAGVPSLLSWGNGSLFSPGDGGFWDIQLTGSAQWHDTPGIVTAAIAGDLDGDGDQDLLVAGTRVETVDKDGVATLASVAHVVTWERTASGLVQRSEVYTQGPFIGTPFSLADVDGDVDLDVLAYLEGVPVGFINDGSFRFTRKELGPKTDDYASDDGTPAVAGPIGLVAADRNGDDAPDLLLVLGRPEGFDSLVIMNDGKGAFMAPGSAVRDDPASSGLLVADVTGDGLADVIGNGHLGSTQELRLTASIDATTLASPVPIASIGAGLHVADIDEDGHLDVVTTIDGRAVALIAREGTFEQRDLNLVMPSDKLDFVTDPGDEAAPARLFVSQKICSP